MGTVKNGLPRSMETTSHLTFRPLKSDVAEVSNNNNNSKIEGLDDNGNQNKEPDLNLGDTTDYTSEELNSLFKRGQEYERSLRPAAALQCYLGCMKGSNNGKLFDHLPQCIHKVADIYRRQQQNGHSVQFAQTEQLFHETALRDIDDIQQMIDEIAKDVGSGAVDLNELNINALQAEDYENLAKECWLKHQHQLALEYAGRSTKLRQQIYGKNSQKAKLSMSLFLAIYIELRSQNDPDSYMHIHEQGNHWGSAGDLQRSPDVVMSKPSNGIPVSILRQRSEDGTKEAEREKKQVRFHESVDKDLRQKERAEENASVTRMFIHLAIFVVIMASMGLWFYCLMDKTQTCQGIVLQFHKWLRAVKSYFRPFSST
ncbi:unnamed protein product [Candidula unifasciata]|uniref:Consortin N-terminal domain-containing protein n=1 Tax=Candidula unifasciata TaxID=100452 RepID=A0A8S3YLD8_9EUPU|nr:unnamed protein product [Candidula unifasciata]